VLDRTTSLSGASDGELLASERSSKSGEERRAEIAFELRRRVPTSVLPVREQPRSSIFWVEGGGGWVCFFLGGLGFVFFFFFFFVVFLCGVLVWRVFFVLVFLRDDPAPVLDVSLWLPGPIGRGGGNPDKCGAALQQLRRSPVDRRSHGELGGLLQIAFPSRHDRELYVADAVEGRNGGKM